MLCGCLRSHSEFQADNDIPNDTASAKSSHAFSGRNLGAESPLFSLPIVIGLTAFMAVSEAPGILRDWTINQNPVTLDSGDIRDGKCTTRKGFFTTCSADLNYTYNGQSYDKAVEIMFVDIHDGDYDTNLVISADHPDLATLSLGIEALEPDHNARRVRRSSWRRQHRRDFPDLACLARPQPIAPTCSTRAGPGGNHGIRPAAQAIDGDLCGQDSREKTGRVGHTRLELGQEPLLIGENGGKAVGLAVWHGNTSLPVLLDERLERIEMTAEERAKALAPLAAELGGHPPELVARGKKGPSIMTRLARFFLVIILIIGGIFGYWLWYVTSASSQFTSPAMDINNMMPAPFNRWGCDQLKKRFGDQHAPFGCTASDYTSWK